MEHRMEGGSGYTRVGCVSCVRFGYLFLELDGVGLGWRYLCVCMGLGDR